LGICDGVLSSKVNETAPLKPAQSSTFRPPAAPLGWATPVLLGASERLAQVAGVPVPVPPVPVDPPVAEPLPP